jgi:inhibitor of KinA sporulation pathway (predicted exonuclease)
MEIIEIGAVRLADGAGPVDGEFSSFVRPVVATRLSEFCTRLTSIRQQDVDRAPHFWEVFPKFVEWIGPDPFVLCSWGGYDLNQFRQDCHRHHLALPTTFERHVNLKKEFARLRNVRICGMAKALQIAGIPLEGTHHRAADDARNIAKLATWILPRLEAEGTVPRPADQA